MPRTAKAKTAEGQVEQINIVSLRKSIVGVRLIGTEPIYFNRMAAKARRELLMPKGRKTQAERQASLKHNPIAEFRDSAYIDPRPNAPTALLIPSPSFKGAMMTAALDLPGTRRTQIGRLTFVQSRHVAVYGVPFLKMDVVRSADMNHTPDIRSRAFCPQWCCEVSVGYIKPQLNEQSLADLIAAAGMLAGVGDFRQEKGKGSFGMFKIADDNDKDEWDEIVKTGGRDVQLKALEEANPYDAETAELLSWFQQEVKTRWGKDDPTKVGGEQDVPRGRGGRGRKKSNGDGEAAWSPSDIGGAAWNRALDT